jgi:hypothetical protein
MPNGPQTPPPQVVIPGAGWVDVASRAIVQVGFPVVVAGVLLWFLLTKFQDNMNTITTRMAHNTEAAGALIEQEQIAFQELKIHGTELTEQTKLMRSIATDAAKVVEMRTQELDILRQILRQQQEGKRP